MNEEVYKIYEINLPFRTGMGINITRDEDGDRIHSRYDIKNKKIDSSARHQLVRRSCINSKLKKQEYVLKKSFCSNKRC